MTFGDDSFMSFEDAGVKEVRKSAFVLVAGGLGERLGYNGIKVYNLLIIIDTLFSPRMMSSIKKTGHNSYTN